MNPSSSTLSTGKSVAVVALVIGCFAVLLPKVLLPTLIGTKNPVQPGGISSNGNLNHSKG